MFFRFRGLLFGILIGLLAVKYFQEKGEKKKRERERN